MDILFNSAIQNRKQGVLGYWGPSDALHQFCEPHYYFTSYSAELFNSISSLAYTAAAMYGATTDTRRDRLVQAEWLMLAIIGAGSTSFHSTMLFKYELWDELPMMGLCLISSLARSSVHPWLKSPSSVWFFRVLVVSLHLFTAASYVIYHQYEIFMNGFTALLLLDVAMSFTWGKCGPDTRLCSVLCIVLLAAGKLLWEVENRLCSSYPSVWPLHVAWHFLSCGGAYYSVRATALRRAECGIEGMNGRWCKVE